MLFTTAAIHFVAVYIHWYKALCLLCKFTVVCWHTEQDNNTVRHDTSTESDGA